ncbi:hypothetical protein [Phycicoccus jejuensis]|uniref:hypothetical protein n=1 Tax=Phycicoccus jejuensis TaxID=367299 RepID=UPI0012FCCB17|nr:hypothetical protein [Phycicoccus jejuensis]
MPDSLNADLDGTMCARSDCSRVADVIGNAVLRLNPLVGALGSPDDPMSVDLPLCVDDAHLLRMEPTLERFSDGLN